MDPEVSFGAWVTRQRKVLDLTREQLALSVGYSVSGLRKIENDERRPSREMAELLANALHIPLDQRQTFLQVARGQLRVGRLAGVVPAKAADPASDSELPQPTFQLPIPPTLLVGREAELAALARLLLNPECRLLSLVGPGGIGKTRLAIEGAARYQESFPDGACFVSLASLQSSAFLVPAIADALGFVLQGQTEPQLQLLNHLCQKKMLLVLDNVEHLLAGAGLFAKLLKFAPELKLLVTSRERLNLQGEWVFEIQGLPVPPGSETSGIEAYGAVALFLQSARRVQAGFELRAEDKPAIVRICQMVEGMPLGIELAAAWASMLTCQDIAMEIERSLDFLATAMRDVPERQRSLRAAFDHSWGLLSEDERTVLSRLAIFEGGFERKAAERVVGVSLMLLLSLVSKSLVRRKENGRFDFHEAIRQYAQSHLTDDPLGDVTRDRHCEFYLALLRDREKALKGAYQGEVMRELTNDIDNIRAAWAYAIKHDKFETIGPALRSYGWLCDCRGWLQDGFAQLELVVRALGSKPANEERQKVLGQALAQQGLLAFRGGQFNRAMILFEESLALLWPIGDPALLTDPLVLSGIIQHLNGELDLAQTYLAEGWRCARAVDDQWYAAYALYNQGYIASLLGNYAAGYDQMLAGLATWRKLGNARAIALGLNFLSPTALHLGRYEEAQAFLQESLALCTQISDRWGMGTAYRFLGLVALVKGDIPEAQALLHWSLELFSEFITGWDVVLTLIYLGETNLAADDTAGAWQVFVDALRLATEVEATPLALDALVGIATLQARTGHDPAALALASCVMNHPASTQKARDRAGQLAVQLGSPSFEAGASDQVRPFDELVAELLNTVPIST